MLNLILGALWFFLPAGFANVMPLYAARIPELKKFDQPMDMGGKFRGKRVFGAHKTWRGLVFSFIVTIPVVALQVYLYNRSEFIKEISFFDYNSVQVIVWAFLLSFGALTGDAVKSFFKRQVGVKPGQSWMPFDQIDYVIGGLAFSTLVVQLELPQYIAVVLIWWGIHPVMTYIGYLLKIREQPI